MFQPPPSLLDPRNELGDLIRRANNFEAVSTKPEWRLLLDTLAAVSDNLLAQLRTLDGKDESALRLAHLRWKSMEDVITLIQNTVLGTIEDRNRYIKEYLEQHGVPQTETERLMSKIGGLNGVNASTY